MEGNNIRKDKELARAALKGLIIYAGQAAAQGRGEEAEKIRRIVDEMSGYWGVDGQRDWAGECGQKIREAGKVHAGPPSHSSILRIKAFQGLCRYAEEMAEVQGMEEIGRILEIADVARRMGEAWELPQEAVDRICCRITETAEALGETVQHTDMGISL